MTPLFKRIVDRRYHAHLQFIIKNVESRLERTAHILTVIPLPLELNRTSQVLTAIRRVYFMLVVLVSWRQKQATLTVTARIHLCLVRCRHIREVNLQISLGL